MDSCCERQALDSVDISGEQKTSLPCTHRDNILWNNESVPHRANYSDVWSFDFRDSLFKILIHFINSSEELSRHTLSCTRGSIFWMLLTVVNTETVQDSWIWRHTTFSKH